MSIAAVFCVFDDLPAFPGGERTGASSGVAEAVPVPSPLPRENRGGIPSETVVLRVDGDAYTLQDLREYVTFVLEEATESDADLPQHVPGLAKVLVLGKEIPGEMPRLKDDLRFRNATARFQAKILSRVYYEEQVRKVVNPSVEEIAKNLPDRSAQYHVSVITFQDDDKVAAVEECLSGGEPFEACAKRFSDGLSRDAGGDIGNIEDGKYDLFTEEEFRNIKALRDGQVSKPFRTRVGWAVVKLNRYWSPQELKQAEAERNYTALVGERRQKRFREQVGEIGKRSSIVWDEEFLARLNVLVERKEPIPEELLSRPVVTVNGVPVYPFAFERLQQVHSAATLDSNLDSWVKEEMVAQEAARLGYREKTRTLFDIQEKWMLVKRYYEARKAGIDLSDAGLRKFYEENRESFRSQEYRQLIVIETDEPEAAREAFRKAAEGADFADLAGKYNRMEEAREKKGNLGIVSRKEVSPTVADAVFSAKEGGVVGPFEVLAKGNPVYTLVKVVKIFPPEVIPFDRINRAVLADKVVSGEMTRFHEELERRVMPRHKVETFNFLGGDRA